MRLDPMTENLWRQRVARRLLLLAMRVGRWGGVSYRPFRRRDVLAAFSEDIEAWPFTGAL